MTATAKNKMGFHQNDRPRGWATVGIVVIELFPGSRDSAA